jgi:hypothetical protein
MVKSIDQPSLASMAIDMENRVVCEVLGNAGIVNNNYANMRTEEVVQVIEHIIHKMFKRALPGMRERVGEYINLYLTTGQLPYIAAPLGARVPRRLKRPDIMPLPKEPIMDTDDIVVSVYDPIRPTVISGASLDRPDFIIYVAEPDARVVDLTTLITAGYNRVGPGAAAPPAAGVPAIRHQTEFTEEEIRNLAKGYNALNGTDFQYVRITQIDRSVVPVKLQRLSDDVTEYVTPAKVSIDYKDGTSNLKLMPGEITQYYRWLRNQVEPSLTFQLYTAPTKNYLDKVRLAVDPVDGESDPAAGSTRLFTADGAGGVPSLILSNARRIVRRTPEIITDGVELLNRYVGN